MEDGAPGSWSASAARPPHADTAVPATAPGAPASRRRAPAPRERAINAPWTVLALVSAICLTFAGQLNAPDTTALIYNFGLVPAEFTGGRWIGLFTHILLHGGWLHLFLNATALLAFGAPVARLFGSHGAGALRFLLFFVITGVAGGLLFWALHRDSITPLVGASGAISGLMGGAGRLIATPGRLGGAFSRTALGFILPWVAINILIAVLGSTPGIGLPIAWEAHLGGLGAGLLLIGLFAPRRPR